MRRESLDSLASRQYGLFSRAQALALGFTAKQVDGGARSGRWARVHRGVYRMPGVPASPHQSLLAAVLAAGPDAVASHRAAAWLWGMADELRLDLAGTMQRSPGPSVTVHRRPRSDLRPVVRRAIPCTDPLRTVLDLAGTGDANAVERALDRGIAGGLFTAGAVRAELARQAKRGRPGVQLLRACLLERLDGPDGQTSALESAMDRIVLRHRLPLPERQYCLPGTRYRLDYAWVEVRLVVEVDGYGSHTELDAFRHDRERQNALVLAGWTVLRFTWHDVCRRPAAVAATIRRALRARRPA